MNEKLSVRLASPFSGYFAEEFPDLVIIVDNSPLIVIGFSTEKTHAIMSSETHTHYKTLPADNEDGKT